jgi:hypothetical protein
MKHTNFEPTPEQLHLAFRHLRRPGWPATVEEALRDHVRAVCIRGLAKSMSRPQFGGQQRTAPRTPVGAPPVPPTPTQPPLRRQAALVAPSQRGGKRFDAKRAAANDRDDD